MSRLLCLLLLVGSPIFAASEQVCARVISSKVRSLIESQIGGSHGAILLFQMANHQRDLKIFRKGGRYVFVSPQAFSFHEVLTQALGHAKVGIDDIHLGRLLAKYDRLRRLERESAVNLSDRRVGRFGWALFSLVGVGLVASQGAFDWGVLDKFAEYGGIAAALYGAGMAGWDHNLVRREKSELESVQEATRNHVLGDSEIVILGMLNDMKNSELSLFYFDPPEVLRETVIRRLTQFGFEEIRVFD